MRKGKVLMLIFLVLCFLSISAVSADDNITDDFSDIQYSMDEVALSSENQAITSGSESVGNWSDLNTLIKNTDLGDTLELDRDFKNTQGAYYISIDHDMTVDGKGHMIDSGSLSRVFNVRANNVTLKNINFINGNGIGGFIDLYNYSNLYIINSTFSNSFGEYGGAVYLNEYSNVYITDSTFLNCSAEFGGALYLSQYSNAIITGSGFENNAANVIGGSVLAYKGCSVEITRTDFTRNTAKFESGGAIMLLESNLHAEYVNFTDCASQFGGAVSSLSSNCTITYSSFKRNRAVYDGGAVFSMYGSLSFDFTNITDSSAERGGGIFSSLTEFALSNSCFINDSESKAGAVYLLTCVSTLENNTGLSEADFYETLNDNLTITSTDYYQIIGEFEDYSPLPSYYNMNDHNYLTPVKDQGIEGNCWAFAAMASLESCILKATGLTLDLSEANLKNIMAKYSNYGYNILTNNGGFGLMVYAYLASWLGPINEEEDSYYINDFLSPLLPSIVHVQNILELERTSYTDNDAIKDAIIKYGAVVTSMSYNSFYLSDSNSYYCYNNENKDHAVCIVGWDDTYNRSNFKMTPEGDGAWIVRNSWGNSWGDDGYFYVSYYDHKFAEVGDSEAYTFILNNTVNLDRVYQYEIIQIASLNISADAMAYKNIFKSLGGEYLSAVSTYFLDACRYKVEIYLNDILYTSKNGTAEAGYFTVNLDEMINLNADDIVTVLFNCTDFKNGQAKIPISVSTLNNDLFITEGVSYYWSANRWIDFSTQFSAVACIKMFTTFSTDAKSTLYLDVECEYYKSDDGYLISVIAPADACGIISISTSSNSYTLNLSCERSVKIYDLNESNNIFIVKFMGDEKYLEKTVSFTMDLSKSGSFKDLYKKFNSLASGGILNLTRDYCLETPLIITKSLTIDGNGCIISGNDMSKIFEIHADGVVLKNIKFTGGIDEWGGAVTVYGNNCQIINCTFEDNSADNAGAIYWTGEKGILTGCTFNDNNATKYGGAVVWLGNWGVLNNSTFKNNSATFAGAALCNNNCSKLENCIFTANSVSDSGGALYLLCGNCSTVSCLFENNYAVYGGAIFWKCGQGNLEDCIFTSNYVSGYGGAVYFNGNGTISDSSFTDNSASLGGAVFWRYDNGTLINSTFTDNWITQLIGGGAVYWFAENGTLSDSTFINNLANNQIYWHGGNGTIIGCRFLNNTGNNVISNNDIFIKHTIDLTYSNISFDYRNPIPVGVLLDLPEGLSIDTEIIFTVTGSRSGTYRIYVKDNAAALFDEVADFEVGNYNIRVVFNGDDNYNPFDVSFTLSVNPVTSYLSMEFENTTVAHKTALNVSVCDGNGIPLSEGIVLVYDGETVIGSFNVDGNVLRIDYNPLIGGEHIIRAVFSSNNYLASNATAKMYVDSAKISVSANPGTVGYTSTFVASVSGLYSIVDDGIVKFFVGDEYLGEVRVVNGTASIDYIPHVSLNTNVFVVFDESVRFDADAEYSNYTVYPAQSSVSLDSLTGKVGESARLTANVTSPNGLVINEGTLTFTDNGNDIGTVSVLNGSASIDHVFTSAGKHTISAHYKSNNYVSSDDEVFVSVAKAQTAIVINGITDAYYGASLRVSAEVLANGRAVNEGSVKFYINGEEISTQKSFDYTTSEVGIFNITAVFFESNNYLTSQSSKVFKVTALPTLLISSNVEMIYNEEGYIVADLKDINGRPLGGAQLCVNLNGVRYFTTDINGQIRVPVVGFIPNIYTVSVRFDADKNHASSSVEVKLTVKKATPKITAKSKTFKKSVKTKKYKITLKDNMNKVMKNVKVSIKINRKTYKAKTNAKGVAKFKITKLAKKGTFKSVITYKANMYYNKVTKTVKIKVK